MKETEEIHESIQKQMTDVVPAALAKIQVLTHHLEDMKEKNQRLENQIQELQQEISDLKGSRGEI
jgi:FtsZ-binding cell division protein ZapB